MRRFFAVAPLAVVLVTCVAFWPALQGEFNWDDDVNLVNNPYYRGFGASQIKWMFTTTLMGHYMPLTWLSLALDHAVGRMSPWGYHLTSLLLHGANAVLLYLIARRLLAAAFRPATAGTTEHDSPTEAESRASSRVISAGAVVAALVFAVHPQRVESVAWISDRGTILCGAFYLLAILAYLRAIASSGEPRHRGWGVASVLAFAGALLSKGMAMSLPLTLLILDVYPLRRRREGWPRLLREKAPYFALAIAGATVAFMARSEGAAMTGYASYALAARIALAGYSFAFYPLTLVWPANLSPLYEVPGRVSPFEPRFLVPMASVVVLTLGLFALRRRIPGALAAWAHLSVVVAPVSGIAHSGLQMVADRYGYLAQLGFIVLAGHGFAWILDQSARGRVPRRAVTVVVSGVTLALLALGSLTWNQSEAWRDPEMLWGWAVDVDPTCARCHYNLGVALMRRRRDEAGLQASEDHLRQAVALRSDHAEAHLNLGTVALMRRRYAEAEPALREYMRRRPEARDGPERLAVLYLVQGRADEAIPLLRRARGMSITDARADRGSTPHSPDRARVDIAEAVQLLDDSETLRYLGQALLEQGLAADAILPLRRAVALNSTASAPRFWLAQAYRSAGQMAKADEELAALRATNRSAERSPVR